MLKRYSPVSVTRCNIFVSFGATLLTGSATSGSAVGIEPLRLSIASYRIRPLESWPLGLSMRIIALANLHACEPGMSAQGIVQAPKVLKGDVVFLLGDNVAGIRAVTRYLDAAKCAPPLGKQFAQLGVHVIPSNHEELTKAGIRVLENETVPLSVHGREVWLAGLADQIALAPFACKYRRPRKGLDDLTGALAMISGGTPAILLAHEPNIAPKVPARVVLTLSGHRHGGQSRAFSYSPVLPSRYDNRYAYGHVHEHADRVVSGGLGMSTASIRFGVPPQITATELVGGAVS